MDLKLLDAEIEYDEGRVPYVYKDSDGWLTCGIGFLVDRRKGGRIPDAVMEFWLDYVVKEKEAEMDKVLPWWRGVAEPAQRVMMNMAYQLGVEGLAKFTTFLGLIQSGDLAGAAKDLAGTALARQTPNRVKRHIELLTTGQRPRKE